jgi:hypothetical protein
MPVWGTGPRRTDGQTNPQINATPYTQLAANYPRNRTGGPIMGYRFLPYTQLVSNYGLWYDAMDTSTIKDTAGNFPPSLPPNRLRVVEWRDKSANARHLQNYVTQPSFFNLLGNDFYPNVNSPGYTRSTDPNSGYQNLRGPQINNPPSFYNGSSITAFFVLSIEPNANPNTFFALTSTVNTQNIPINPNGPNPSTFDFSFNYISNTIGFSRFGGGGPQFGLQPRGSNNVLTAPLPNITSTNLISIQINPNPTTIGSVLPSTNTISINGAFVSSSTRYAGNPFNFVYYSMFGAYNFPANSFSYFNEVGIFFRTLTTPERVAYQSQLIRKWGLPSNAPITYINSLPVTTGLFGWYDAYDDATVLRNTSNNVSMWLDKSGQNNHMSTNLLTFGSNTGSNIYYSSISISTNQFPSLFFPSTFAFMQTSTLITNQNLSSMTMIAVKRGTKIVSGAQLRTVSVFSTINSLEGGGGVIGATGNQFYNFNFPYSQLASNFSTFHINTLLGNVGPTAENGVNSLNAVSYYNGTNAQTNSGFTFVGNLYPSYMRLMNGPFNDQDNGDARADSGYLGEVLLYNRILNSNELSNTHTYLLNKWGISTLISNVPVTSGLNLWLDCYDPLTMTFSTNTTQVRQWRDKSLCNFHMSNPGILGSARMPTYTTASPSGLPSLQFSNSAPATTFFTNLYNTNFTYPQTRETTLFISYSSTSNSGFYGPLFTMLSNDEVFYDRGNGFELNVTNGDGGIGLVRSTVRIYNSLIPNTHNTTTLASVVFNSTFTDIPDIPQRSFGLSRNGVVRFVQPSSLISSVGFLSTQNFLVNQASLGTRGATAVGDSQWYYSGFIHEVLQYNRALTFVERQQVESYLLSKWNI